MNKEWYCIYVEKSYDIIDQHRINIENTNFICFNPEEISPTIVFNLLETYGKRNEEYFEKGKVLLIVSDWTYRFLENYKPLSLSEILWPSIICYKDYYLNFLSQDLKYLHNLWLKNKEYNIKLNHFYNKFVTKEFLEYIDYVA